MHRIAIFRQAKKEQVSSVEHLVLRNDRFNSDPKFNKNFNKENVLFVRDNGRIGSLNFVRNGLRNDLDLVGYIKEREGFIDKLAREDYKNHKLAEKAENPTKKVRTVLQSKDLKREFIIAFGGDDKYKSSAFAKKSQIKEFITKMLKAKGLDDRNLICATYHQDEKYPHLHVQYNCYSFDKHTTEIELEKRSIKELAKTNKFDSPYDAVRENFSKWQDKTVQILNDIGVDCVRGEKDSKRKNISKFQHLEEEIKKKQAELLKLQQANELEITNKQAMIDKLNNIIQKKELVIEDYKAKEQLNLKAYAKAVTEKSEVIVELNNLKAQLKPIEQLQDSLAKDFEIKIKSIIYAWKDKGKEFIDSRIANAKSEIKEKYTEQVKKIVNQDIEF